ncbi:MAG TPA: hypothetical protein VGE62_00200 [Candidatus Paceibacterota bacterium]
MKPKTASLFIGNVLARGATLLLCTCSVLLVSCTYPEYGYGYQQYAQVQQPHYGYSQQYQQSVPIQQVQPHYVQQTYRSDNQPRITYERPPAIKKPQQAFTREVPAAGSGLYGNYGRGSQVQYGKYGPIVPNTPSSRLPKPQASLIEVPTPPAGWYYGRLIAEHTREHPEGYYYMKDSSGATFNVMPRDFWRWWKQSGGYNSTIKIFDPFDSSVHGWYDS